MPRDLTKHVADHDDATSRQHAIDVAQKKERQKTHYEPVPAVEIEAGSRVIDGVFASPVKGFSFRMTGGSAIKAKDAAKYTKDAVEMSKKRARYKRVRERDGKTRQDYGRYTHGAVSLVTTLPPWAQLTCARIGPAELENLMLCLAEVQAAEIHTVSGRDVFGGGVHLDTALGHWHLHVPKTSETGEVHPKGQFLTAGPWIVGASRIQAKFPGLLNASKVERLERHLARKDKEHLIDVRCAAVIDAELERWIKDRGLWRQYQDDCDTYCKRKKKAQKEEPLKRLMQAALGHHARSGVWPLAYRAMTLTAWRMIPPELREVITLAIRANQIIRKPSKIVTMATNQVPGVRTAKRVKRLATLVGALPSQPEKPKPKPGNLG